MPKKTSVSPDTEGFVMSHLQFTLADRYSGHANWFLAVTVSVVSELPLPERMLKQMAPAYVQSLRRTYSNLFEYAKTTFPELTYAQYQNILYKFMKKLERTLTEKHTSSPDGED